MIRYVVDPGKGQEVLLFTTVREAWLSQKELAARGLMPSLYAFQVKRRMWRRWVEKEWYDVEPTSLPMKVLATERKV